MVIVALGAAFNSIPTEAEPLEVGQLTVSPSLLFTECPLELVPFESYRNEAFPSTTPLPTLLAELPDIINPLIGLHDSDLAVLVDNDLIEPLDPFFERLGVDPKQLLLPSVYEAVSYKGQIWALPHRAHTYLLSYDREILKSAQIRPEFQTWENIFGAAQTISEIRGLVIEGSFYLGRVPDEAILPFLIWYSGLSVPGWQPTPPSALDLHRSNMSNKVIAINDPYESSPLCLESYSSVPSPKDRGLVSLPNVLSASHPESNKLGSFSFLECFEEFIKWLISTKTQLQLVEASRLDCAPNKRKLGRVHIPLYQAALETSEFKRLVEQVPEYGLFLDFVSNSAFSAPGNSEIRQFVLHRRETAMDVIWTAGMGAAAEAIFEPRSAEEDQLIASTARGKKSAQGNPGDY
jgi:hypothetical protein